MKKNRIIAIIASAVIIASIATTICITCSALKISNTSTPNTISFASEHIGFINRMPCPLTQCKSIEEAQKISGINFDVPEYSQSTILAYKGIIQIKIAKDEFHTITICKSAAKGDNTGIFGEYKFKTINIDDCEVILKFENDKIYAAYLTGEDGTISISCEDGLFLNDIKEMLQQFIVQGTKAK